MNNLFDLSGQAAIVTGGSRGLGKEMALALGQAGSDLLVGSRHEQDIVPAARELSEQTKRKVVPCVVDVSRRESVEAMVELAMKSFGRIDVLVNNAGVNVRSPIEKVRDEDWQLIQQVNSTGVFNCCRAVVGQMVRAGYGRIINVGSALSLVGLAERVSYAASKGAVLQITRTLAVELADKGVTVNCLCPGPFATEINRSVLDNPQASAALLRNVPMGRWAEMHEIRAPVVFLASPASSYVTGAVLSVDGGWAAR